MKKKFLSLFLFSLLLTSCQNNNIYLTSELKYDEYKLSLEIFNKEEGKQYTKSLIMDEDLSNQCVSLYNELLKGNTSKRISDRDGFTGTDYYYCLFKGEYTTSLLIHKDDNYKILVNGYNINYVQHTYEISSINNELKEKVDNLVPLLQNALKLVEWEETHNFC